MNSNLTNKNARPLIAIFLAIYVILAFSITANGYVHTLKNEVRNLTEENTKLLSQVDELSVKIEDIESRMNEKSVKAVSDTVYFEDPHETEKINEALYDEGYIREDVPLDTDTQLLLRAATDEFDIPYELALAVIWQETNYQNITGDSGNASGYMQIWEYWNRDRMDRIGANDLMNPIDNFRTGCCILSENYERTGSYYDALSIYNTGSSGWSPYADAVMSKWESLDT